MKLAPYPDYKDSGVLWLGKIPAHWDVKPGMAFISQRKEKNVGMKESTVLSLSYGQIVIKPLEKLHGLVPESFETYQIADPGNIIIRGTDLQNDKTSLRVGKVRNRGIITSAYLCLQTNEKINPDYAHLLLHGYDLMKIYYGMGSGLRQNLDFSDFKRLPVLVPSPTEQSKIHKYVESVHAQINKFIRNKRRLIELLKEQKQNIINQAVTRGLDPKVKLKPSGVEWIGDIPEHWEAIKLRNLLKPVSSRNRPDLPLLSVVREKGVIVRDVDDLEGNHNFIPDDLSNYRVVLKGQFAMNKMKAWQGSYGVSDFDGIVSPAYFVFEMLGKVQPEFFHLAIRSKTYVPFFIKASDGVRIGQWDLSIPRMKEIPFFIPSPEEQGEIVGFVREQHSAIDQTITRAEREIELMREYRTRLISDVVTGQVDVRNVKCEGGSLNEDEFEDIEEVEEEIELPEGGEDDE